MDARLQESQKKEDAIAAFWPRHVSPYVTRVLVRTPITPNQTTILWGVLSVLNSWTVYMAMTGHLWAIPVVPAVYVFCYVLDCVDGEIARFKKISNPVGGKLLDGICHRATEYSLLGVFAAAAWHLTRSPLALLAGIVLLTGEAMYTYVYERRLLTLRTHVKATGHLARSASGVYVRGATFASLTSRQKVGTVAGQLHYKSIYPVIALSYVSGEVLLAGLALLGLYKHLQWVRLIRRTLAAVAAVPAAAPTDAPADPKAAPADSVGGLAR